jgi:hypothetical protein
VFRHGDKSDFQFDKAVESTNRKLMKNCLV